MCETLILDHSFADLPEISFFRQWKISVFFFRRKQVRKCQSVHEL